MNNVLVVLLNLPLLLVGFFFPQFEANKKNREGVSNKRWAWIVRPLGREARQYILSFKGELCIRWLILLGPVTYLAATLGPPWGAFVYGLFYFSGAWTFIGLAVTYAHHASDKNPIE